MLSSRCYDAVAISLSSTFMDDQTKSAFGNVTGKQSLPAPEHPTQHRVASFPGQYINHHRDTNQSHCHRCRRRRLHVCQHDRRPFLSNPVYIADKVWVGLTAATSIILLLCGIAGMVFKYVDKVPDILGYVSTMTRDNPYFEDPVGGDAMDGLERARVLKHVQIVDVKPWDKRGYIALRRVRSE
jgi:hypothetical protein